MGRPKVRRIVDISHPEVYDLKDIHTDDLYVKVTRLSEARELIRFIKLERQPYILVVEAGFLEGLDVGRTEMRLFCVYTPHKKKIKVNYAKRT